jgi:hypothetical protein
MFDKLDKIYELYNIYKSVIVTSNDDNELLNTVEYFNNNGHEYLLLTPIYDICDKNNISNINLLTNFKDSNKRVLIMTYSTWYNNQDLIKLHILPEQNLFVVGNILEDNIFRIYKWYYTSEKEGYKYNNNGHFLELYNII